MEFDTRFEPRHGVPVDVAPRVRRLTAANGGPFTFHGTNTYLIGADDLVILDPGPDDPRHCEAILAAIGGARVSAILVSHTHRDHSELAPRLARLVGAPTCAAGPHRPARPLAEGEVNTLDASADHAFQPDHVLADGASVPGVRDEILAIATPGHCANHMVFAVPDLGVLFSADHVMGWSTSIVAPPDGAMADYMASLDRVIARPEAHYLPGHGGPVSNGPDFARALKVHRLHRERAILDRVRAGDGQIRDMVARIYATTPKALHGAAALSVLAHLEDLVARGLVSTDGPPSLSGHYAAGPA